MRRFTLLLCCIFSVGFIMGQQAGEWKRVDSKSSETKFYRFVGGSENHSLAIVTMPTDKKEKGFFGVIRWYDADLSFYEDFAMPEESPMHYSVSDFAGHIIVSGYNFSGTGPYISGLYEQIVLCLSDDGKVMGRLCLKKASEKNYFQDGPSLFLSGDGDHLIVVSKEGVSREEPEEDTELFHLIVLDRDFKQVWRDSIDFNQKFGKGTDFRKTRFDYTQDGKLIMMVGKVGSAPKKEATKLMVSIYDAPGNESHYIEQTFAYYTFRYRHVVKDDGSIYICGITMNQWSGSGNGMNQLFVLGTNYKTRSAKTYTETQLDKNFYKAYPPYSKDLKNHIQEPGEVFLMNDGLLYISLYALISEGQTYGISEDITLIKFGFDGKIQWLKMIIKEDRITPENLYFKAYSRGNDVLIFYTDHEKKAKGDKPGPIPSDNPYGLALAVVSSDGTIKECMIDNRKKDRTIFDLTSLFQVNEDRYLIKGVLSKDHVKTEYVRTIVF